MCDYDYICYPVSEQAEREIFQRRILNVAGHGGGNVSRIDGGTTRNGDGDGAAPLVRRQIFPFFPIFWRA